MRGDKQICNNLEAANSREKSKIIIMTAKRDAIQRSLTKEIRGNSTNPALKMSVLQLAEAEII